MALYSYEIKAGFNEVTGLTNFESIFTHRGFPPRGERMPLGGVTRTTISGIRITDGQQLINIRYSVALFTDLTSYVTTYFTDWNNENAEVTIGTRRRNGNFSYFNAIAHLPLDGVHYRHINTTYVEDLTLPFYIIGIAS